MLERKKPNGWKKVSVFLFVLIIAALLVCVGLFVAHTLKWINLQEIMFPEQSEVAESEMTYDEAHKEISAQKYFKVSVLVSEDSYIYTIYISSDNAAELSNAVTFKDKDNKTIEIFYGVPNKFDCYYEK